MSTQDLNYAYLNEQTNKFTEKGKQQNVNRRTKDIHTAVMECLWSEHKAIVISL